MQSMERRFEYIINEVIEKGDTDAIANNKAAIMDTINAS